MSGVMGLREVVHPEGYRWGRSSVVDEEVLVRVAQRVDFDLLVDPVVARPGGVRITVGGVLEMDAAQARALARCLGEAAERAEQVEPTTRTGSGVRRIGTG